MRKFIFLAIFAVVGLSAWICLADGKETKGEETAEEEMAEEETQPWISPEDSAMFIEVFETYLDYDMDFANSSMKYAESMRKGAGKDYHKSRKHIDSMFHDCIELVKLGDFEKMLELLETERLNIYRHPGNSIDNEIGLVTVFAKMYNQIYPESTDSFYMKMLPKYQFMKTHIEVKRALTDEEEFHPIYEEILKIIDNAHEVLGNDSTYDKWY